MPIDPGDRILFMKVGIHAGESLDDIVRRKRQEIAEEGHAFWGYGGSTFHPRTMVQPFAAASPSPIVLVMNPMTSKHFAEPVRAEEFSEDGVNWAPVPPGIDCRGSRYALLLGDLEEVDETIDLARTRVAVGPNTGRVGATYIQGRADKACLEVTDSPGAETKELAIGLRATILKPFAVFLRNS
jgi:hypothetical protein